MRTAARRPRDGETVANTVRRLAGVQKGARGAPAYSRFVNRRLGRLLAAIAFHMGATPNGVTVVSALCTFSAIAMLALGSPTVLTGLAIGLLLVLGYALDSADGQLARLRGGGTPAGEWLDHMVDATKTATLHLGVLIGLHRSGVWDSDVVLLVPLAFAVVSVVLFFAMLLNEAMRSQHEAVTRAAGSGASASIVRSLVVAPTDYGVLCLVFLFWGIPELFLGLYGLLVIGTTAYLLLALPTWFREMRGLGR
ncbi:CDP-alcohol phosphatidyltransferase [Geodermatophilus sp. Leaf369]|nr:CDP-alcohol phosphatidyltransferase [Geodermatophilus sp. Leaf369]